MASETLQKATIETFKLPYGFQLHKHYYFSQYGEIDYSDIRFSVSQLSAECDKLVYVHECYSYEHAMVMFLAQMQAQRPRQFDDLVTWLCKLLDIDTCGLLSKHEQE
jgi:hypothetical protein